METLQLNKLLQKFGVAKEQVKTITQRTLLLVLLGIAIASCNDKDNGSTQNIPLEDDTEILEDDGNGEGEGERKGKEETTITKPTVIEVDTQKTEDVKTYDTPVMPGVEGSDGLLTIDLSKVSKKKLRPLLGLLAKDLRGGTYTKTNADENTYDFGEKTGKVTIRHYEEDDGKGIITGTIKMRMLNPDMPHGIPVTGSGEMPNYTKDEPAIIQYTMHANSKKSNTVTIRTNMTSLTGKNIIDFFKELREYLKQKVS